MAVTTITMSSASSTSRKDPSQEELKQRLKSVANLPENQVCCDCGDKKPTWASLIVPPPGSPTDSRTIGAFCCFHCSGAHRRLGVHICFVRSLTLDDWKEKEVIAVEIGGNKRVNDAFEGKYGDDEEKTDDTVKPHVRSNLDERDAFIKAKYSKRVFFKAWVYRETMDIAMQEYVSIMSGERLSRIQDAQPSPPAGPPPTANKRSNRRASMSASIQNTATANKMFQGFSLEKNNFFSDSKRSLFQDVVAPPSSDSASKIKSPNLLAKQKKRNLPTVKGGGGRISRRNLMNRSESFRESFKALEGHGELLFTKSRSRRQQTANMHNSGKLSVDMEDLKPHSARHSSVHSSNSNSSNSSINFDGNSSSNHLGSTRPASSKPAQPTSSAPGNNRRSMNRRNLMTKTQSFREAVEALEEKEFVPPSRSRGRSSRNVGGLASSNAPSLSGSGERSKRDSRTANGRSTSRNPATRRRGASVRRGANASGSGAPGANGASSSSRIRSHSRDTFDTGHRSRGDRPGSRSVSRNNSFDSDEALESMGCVAPPPSSSASSSSSRRRRQSMAAMETLGGGSMSMLQSSPRPKVRASVAPRSNSFEELDPKPTLTPAGNSSKTSLRRKPPSSRTVHRNHSLDVKDLVSMVQAAGIGSSASNRTGTRKPPSSRNVARNGSFSDSFNNSTSSDRRKPVSGRSVSRTSSAESSVAGASEGSDPDEYFEMANDMRPSSRASRRDMSSNHSGTSSTSASQSNGSSRNSRSSGRPSSRRRSNSKGRSRSVDRFSESQKAGKSPKPRSTTDSRKSRSSRSDRGHTSGRASSKSPSRRITRSSTRRSPQSRTSKSPTRQSTRASSTRSPSAHNASSSSITRSPRSPKRTRDSRRNHRRSPQENEEALMHMSTPDLFQNPIDLISPTPRSGGSSKRRTQRSLAL